MSHKQLLAKTFMFNDFHLVWLSVGVMVSMRQSYGTESIDVQSVWVLLVSTRCLLLMVFDVCLPNSLRALFFGKAELAHLRYIRFSAHT